MASLTTLGDLAAMVGGEVLGDPGTVVSNAWPPHDCDAESITLIDSPESLCRLKDCPAVAAVVPAAIEEAPIPVIRATDIHAAFATLVRHFRPARAPEAPGIHPTAVVGPDVEIGEAVTLGPGAVVGVGTRLGDRVVIGPQCVVGADCTLGDDTLLSSRVTLYDGGVIGRRCRIHSGTVLGADGFGYRQVDGRHVPVPQLGSVVIEDDVEIGSNTTIDRGVYGPTRIGEGTKIDNLVQIGHNCRIGRHNLLCSQVGIAGSTTTGDYVVMAGQVGVRDHVHIGDRAILSAMAGVSNDVPAGEVMLGAPATPLREQKLKFAAIAKLPQLRKEFREMKREIASLKQQLEEAAARRAA